MKKLCIASNNAHKIEEFHKLLGNKYEIVSLNDIGCHEEIPEDQHTIEGNSLQKAKYIFDRYGINCFSDDTGLEVEALNNEPGVYSARYAGEQKNSDDNIKLLLQRLAENPSRRARFRTVITLIENGVAVQFEGIVEGKITMEKRGKNGFGYDAVFEPEEYYKTFAEMTMEEKNPISHRGRAIEKLLKYLEGRK